MCASWKNVLERALAFADGGVIALDGLALPSMAGGTPLWAAPAVPALPNQANEPARHGGAWRGPRPAAGRVFAPGRARHDRAGAGAGPLPPRTAARQLGLSVRQLRYRMQKLTIQEALLDEYMEDR